MPFAYDQSDLDLDKYVLKIAMQLAEITAVSFPCGIAQKLISSSLPQYQPPT
jgi:hypothetical protein